MSAFRILIVWICLSLSISIRFKSLRSKSHHLSFHSNRISLSNGLKGYNSYGDEEKPISPKVIATAAILGIGVFGTGFLGTFKSAVDQVVGPSLTTKTLSGPQNSMKNDAGESNRGSFTRMTKKEINFKLQQIPVFFVSADEGKSIYTKDGVGMVFMEKEDAERLASKAGAGLTFSAAGLDEIYFPLIEKKAKLGAFIEGVAGKSDPSATYLLQASPAQLEAATDEWKSSHEVDVPLYRVPNLAFSKESGLEIPLFTRKEDATNAFERLKETKRAEGVELSATDEQFQLTSLRDLVTLFNTGGFQARALEFYPSMNAIENARAIFGSP